MNANFQTFKHFIFTHDSNHHAIPAVRYYLRELFGGSIPPNIHLSEDVPTGLKIIAQSEMPSMIICSGKTYIGNANMMAKDFADFIKKAFPQATVIAYSQSSEHAKDPGLLDGYIMRGTTPELAEATVKYIGVKECNGHLHDYRIAQFIFGAYNAKTQEEYEQLFLAEDKIFDAVTA